MTPTAGRAQLKDSLRTGRAADLVFVNGDSIDRARNNELIGDRGKLQLLRSASTLTAAPAAGRARTQVFAPQVFLVSNSSLPFSQNQGGLWAGKGWNGKAALGFSVFASRFRLFVAPEFIFSSNSDWARDTTYYAPPLPPGRSEYAFPYYSGPFTIDQPLRLGRRPINRLSAGQSGIFYQARLYELGFSFENEWWGPGLRNALILSNNAPGFPHFVLRTPRAIETRLGHVEARWLVGGLRESSYFDTISTNNSRSLSGFAATLRTGWDPNLTVGFARTVYATARSSGRFAFRWFDVFANTGNAYDQAADSSAGGGRDQLISIFARWVFPASGAEVYGEVGRTVLPRSFRDMLVAPNHSQGYTVGSQWRSTPGTRGSIRVQGEITQLEQSATFRDRPLGSWYTSIRIPQGYTNRGEILGASIGPGASSQWLAADYLASSWSVGTFAGRIRWNEDVHSNYGFPDYVSYCNHDLTVFSGLRGAGWGRFGSVTADLSLQNRLNAFFQNGGGCPNNGRRLDIRNTNFSVSYSPFSFR